MSTPESRRRTVAVAGRTIRALKMAAGCCDCGYREHPDALQFDHRDPATKRRDLGWRDCRSKLWNLTRLNAYLEHVAIYCDVRCANCHAIRTTEQQHWKPQRRGAETNDAAAPPLF